MVVLWWCPRVIPVLLGVEAGDLEVQGQAWIHGIPGHKNKQYKNRIAKPWGERQGTTDRHMFRGHLCRGWWCVGHAKATQTRFTPTETPSWCEPGFQQWGPVT